MSSKKHSKKNKVKAEEKAKAEQVEELEVEGNELKTEAKEEGAENAGAENKEAKEAKSDEPTDEKAVLEAKVAEMTDKYMRLSAEFDNFRKRTLREKADMLKSAGEDVLVNLLPVMDNFERALGTIETATDMEAMKEGIDLIYGNFKDFLTQKGVKEIEAKEQEFDTDVHEALTKIPAPDKKLKGKVVDVIEKGYFLNEKVIRFAKVVVGE